MKYVFILLGAVYVVAILAQMQAYVASTRKTAAAGDALGDKSGQMNPQEG